MESRRVNEREEQREIRRGVMRMVIPAAWNRLTETIIGAAIEVHRALGPGLLERVYEEALVYELRLRELAVQRQQIIRLKYKDLELPEQRLDIVVEGLVIVELKASEAVSDLHLAQLVSYLRAADAPLGLLINFNTLKLTNGVYRRINADASAARVQPFVHSASLDSSANSAFGSDQEAVC
jgi:GxxExxY protein